MRNAAALLLLLVLILISGRAEAVPPAIHARWDDSGPDQQPELDFHYEIIGNPDSPNVLLKVGRPDWRIWSTDLDAADGVGNIGTISSPFNDNFTMKLATADSLMLYWGKYIDGSQSAWDAYVQNILPGVTEAGFTHLGLQIASPTTPSNPTIPPNDPNPPNQVAVDRVAQMRSFGLPLAFFAGPGHQYLKKASEQWRDPTYHSSNGLHAKYFDTLNLASGVHFDPWVYFDPSYCDCHCGASDCPPEAPCDSENPLCNPDNPCNPQALCFHPSAHTLSHDPKYVGPLWQTELSYLRDQLVAASLQAQLGDVIVLDFEVFSKPAEVQRRYPNVIRNSPGRYTGDTVDLTDRFNQYRQAWDARVQDLVDICTQFAPGVPVHFYGKELGEGGWVRDTAAGVLMPIMYYGSAVQEYAEHLDCAKYSGALPFISLSVEPRTINQCPAQNSTEGPPPLEGGVAGSCPTWDPLISQQIAARMRNEGASGVVVYPGPGDDCVVVDDYKNHATALATAIIPTTGARDISGITLVPSAPCTGSGIPFPCCTGNGTGSCGYTNIAAGEISGDLGGLELQQSSGEGGVASVIAGGLNGNVNIPKVNSLEVKGAVSAGSTITIGAFTGGGSAEFNTDGGSFAGDLILQAGIPRDSYVTINGLLTGTASIDFQDAALGGTLSLHNGSQAGSSIDIGPMTSMPGSAGQLFLRWGTYAGDLTVISAARYPLPCVIDADLLTGAVHVPDEFNGDICAANFPVNFPEPPAPLPLPPNVHLSNLGPHGTVCGFSLCPTAWAFSPDATGFNKSRFISFTVDTTDTTERAIGVRLGSLHHVEPPYTGGPAIPFELFEGQLRYLGPPTQYVESGTSGIPFYVSQLQCTPHYQNWSTVDFLHVTGSAIVPSSQYDIGRLAGENAACRTLSVTTARWGDVTAPYQGPPPSVQPDVSDVSALVDKYRNYAGSPIKARAMLAGAPGNPFGEIDQGVLNVDFTFSHISACVDAFRGAPYPYTIASCP